MPANVIEAGRAMVGAAVLAPSYFNAQPWRFEVDAGELRVLLDPQRTLPLADPDQRFAQMSLGAALENLLVAARAWGQQPSVRYLPWGTSPRPGSALVAAAVSWQAAERARDRLLYTALTERRSNPHPFDGRAIAIQSRSQLLAQVGEEVRVHWLEDRDDVRAVGDIVHDGVEAVMADKRAQAERVAWLRGSDGDIREHGDGLTAERMGLGGPARWMAGRSLQPDSRFYGWGSASLAKDTRDLVRSSGALALLTLPRRSDAGRRPAPAGGADRIRAPPHEPGPALSRRGRGAAHPRPPRPCQAAVPDRPPRRGAREHVPHVVARASRAAGARRVQLPLTVISPMSNVGQAIEERHSRSFPTAAIARSMSSELPATVTPSTGNAFSPFSIQ
jgi:hypothetical protein